MWDYPRPPLVRECVDPIEVWLDGELICSTDHSWQVLETSHPPTFYLPRDAFVAGSLEPARGMSVCEFKGQARYLSVVGGGRREDHAAWFYPFPSPGFRMLADHLAVYAGRMDRCTVAGVEVIPQPGNFYGGWIIPSVVGPFKGDPGTLGW
ncbi:MAG: DUF427 domain-containing protein [Micropruina sp.]